MADEMNAAGMAALRSAPRGMLRRSTPPLKVRQNFALILRDEQSRWGGYPQQHAPACRIRGMENGGPT
jgi:hypothetical protein